VCPFGEYLINHVPEKLHFLKDPPLTTNGLVQLPDKPGFGIELDPAKVEKQEVLDHHLTRNPCVIFRSCLAGSRSPRTAQAADITAAARPRRRSRRAPARPEFRALYKELVEINTTLSVGSCTEAANAMKARLVARATRIDQAQVVVPPGWPKTGNLIALLPGSDAKLKPVLLLAHIDVVEARREDWKRDPVHAGRRDGFFYTRAGSSTTRHGGRVRRSMVRFKQEKIPPEARHQARADLRRGTTPKRVQRREYPHRESPRPHRSRVCAQRGGGGRYDQKTGCYRYVSVLAAEKVYQDFTHVHRETGRALPRVRRPTTPSTQLAHALGKIEASSFPIEMNDVDARYFAKFGAIEGGRHGADMVTFQIGDAMTRSCGGAGGCSQDPSANAILHTNCVATQIDGGHAPNALPQHATANVNCRIFPGIDRSECRRS
jgi:hypothetical protein